MDLDLWLNSNPQEFDPHVLDEFMASFDPLSAIYSDHGPALFLEGNSANAANTWDVVAHMASAADDDQLEYIGPAHRVCLKLYRYSHTEFSWSTGELESWKGIPRTTSPPPSSCDAFTLTLQTRRTDPKC
jgi:hypothetical protein